MATPGILAASQLNELAVNTLPDLGRLRFTEMATDLQDHTAFNNLLRKDRVSLRSGKSIQWNVMHDHNHSAVNTGTYATDILSRRDKTTQATADWRWSMANWSLDNKEIDMNREPARIVDVMLEERLGAAISLAELFENNFWGPPVDVNDSVTPWGVNTWFSKNATEGFNGTVPTGFTTVGLNPTTFPRWRSYTFPFSVISKDDFVRKLRKAAVLTNWKPPVDGIPTFNTGDDYGFYTNYAVVAALEEILESQNESLGDNINSRDGKALFRGRPIQWIPKLDADTTNPIYGLNWGTFKTAVLDGWWLRETHLPIYPGQHTVMANFIDCGYQWIARNRRNCFVGSNGVTYPS